MSFSYYCISRDPLTGADDPVGCKPNTQGWDSSIIEIPPYYRGRTSPRGGIVEQQTPGYASQTDSRLWVINPPAPSGNPYPWCVWDADDRVRGDLVGLLPAGGSFSVTLCFIADVNAHRASMSLVEYPQLSGSITFGEFMTLPVSGGRSACVVGAQYRSVSDPRLAPISNTNYPAVGRYEYVTFTVTNTTTASANIVVPTVIGRYLEGIPSQSGLHESRWCPGDTADVGGPSIWQYGNWLYTPYDVSMGTQPAVWWKN